MGFKILWILWVFLSIKNHSFYVPHAAIDYAKIQTHKMVLAKHFEVTNMYKLSCHIKCTVAAAYNLSVHKLQRIMLHRKYMRNFFKAITSLFKGLLKHFCSNTCGIWKASCWCVIVITWAWGIYLIYMPKPKGTGTYIRQIPGAHVITSI